MTKRQMKARREALRELLAEMYGNDVVLLDGPEFDGGLVGATTDGRLVYSYDKLVEALSEANEWSREDAVDWIEFNTIRSLPYVGGPGAGRDERPGPRRVPAGREKTQSYPLTPHKEM